MLVLVLVFDASVGVNGVDVSVDVGIGVSVDVGISVSTWV